MRNIPKKGCSFETSDISLAATLHALGATIMGIDRQDVGRCVFVFKDTLDIQRAVQAYWRRQLSIEPQTLLSGLKAVKSRLYGERL